MKGVKFVLMLAAGVATGLTVVIAVLVQVLVHMLPLLVAIAALVLIAKLPCWSRRSGSRVVPPAIRPAYGWAPPQGLPAPIEVPASPVRAFPPVQEAQPSVITGDPTDSYLSWGPPMPALSPAPTPISRTRPRRAPGCGPARGGRR